MSTMAAEETTERADDGAAAETKKEGKAKKVFDKIKKAERGFFHDFKAFINKGNVVQLAVAFIMGGAFTAIVTSLVGDIFMPFFSLIFGKTNFATLEWRISDALIIKYGNFILAVLNFILISLILFLIVKAIASAASGIKKLKKKGQVEEAAPTSAPPLTKTEELLTEIKDLLVKQEEHQK